MIDAISLQKIENINNCLQRIESKYPFTVLDLTSNYDLQDIITINLQRLIQSSIDLAQHILTEKNARTPKDMADSFVALAEVQFISQELCQNLVKAVGFRNVLVHEYDGIDWQIVHIVSTERLEVFKDYAKIIFNFINN